MKTSVRKPLSMGLFQAALMCVLLLGLIVANAQTFFGSGGSTNSATNTSNVALGYEALFSNTSGIANTALGYKALFANSMGGYNTANGDLALYSNVTGSNNTATGYKALFFNNSGSYNVANGPGALYNTTGSNNIALGYLAGQNLTTGDNNIDIGNNGVAAESGTIRIGTPGTHTAIYLAGLNAIIARGLPLLAGPNGQLAIAPSSRRFKQDIHTMGPVSDRLMQLRPVTFRYKQAAENETHPLQYGLIAEEVAKVYPDLVQYDKAGKPFAVYYHLLTPMLLNELQKEHHQNQVQKIEIAALKAAFLTQSAESASLKSEVAALKQAQQQQRIALAKLTALVDTSQTKTQHQQAVAMQP
jgi:hypothetical protein